MYKLSIDIGTTSIKSVLFAEELRAVAHSEIEYAQSVHGIFIEQDPADWWQCVVCTVKKVLAQSGVEPGQIKAVGVSGQGPTLLPLNEAGVPLASAVIWLDRRADVEAAELSAELGAEHLKKICGKKMDGYHIAPKLLWFKKHAPELFSKTKMLLQSNGFINYKLTGKYSCDRSSASLTCLYDLKTGVWSREIVEAVGADLSILPPVFAGYDPIGTVTPQAAAETGLAAGTLVIAGYVDAMAASLEAGLLEDGTAFESTGTASMIRAGFHEVVYAPNLSSGIGLREKSGSLFGEMSGTGASMRWLRDLFASAGSDREKLAYEEMSRMVEEQTKGPTALIFLPYLAGERSPIWNSKARGVFFGLNLATSAAEMIRAVMEGTSFALRDNIECLRKTGVRLERIRSVGGVCRSDIWLKIKASVINMPIEIPSVSVGAPAGIAMLCSSATQEFSTVEDAMRHCVKVNRIVYPEPAWTEHYDKMFRLYKNVYQHTIDDYSMLNEITAK